MCTLYSPNLNALLHQIVRKWKIFPTFWIQNTCIVIWYIFWHQYILHFILIHLFKRYFVSRFILMYFCLCISASYELLENLYDCGTWYPLHFNETEEGDLPTFSCPLGAPDRYGWNFIQQKKKRNRKYKMSLCGRMFRTVIAML